MALARQSLRLWSRYTRSVVASPAIGGSAKPATRTTQSNRAFAYTPLSRASGQTDSALSAKLKSELKYEKESGESSEAEPEWVTAFKDEGVWKIEDNEGFDEVALTRSFGNEDIRILFSIADLDSTPEESDPQELSEENASDAEASASNQQTSTSSDNPTTTSDESFPVRTAITITKAGQGALTVDAVAQDGLFVVDSIAFYKDPKQATDMSAEGDWKRRALYMGPEFDALDETLQQEFESYLEERGINSNLALFIPDLAEWKEQKEYVRWLEGVQKFVEA